MAYKPFIRNANDEMVELPLCADMIGESTIGSTSEPVYIKNGKPKACSDLKQALVDLIYPIGSYFITESSNYDTTTKVANHFGGTWEKVQGKFLLGATEGSEQADLANLGYSRSGNNYHYWTDSDGNRHNVSDVSSDDGEVKHQLTVREMPSHNHPLRNVNWYEDNINENTIPAVQCGYYGRNGTIWWLNAVNVGDNQPHNNMPPYRTVYMYRRTA